MAIFRKCCKLNNSNQLSLEEASLHVENSGLRRDSIRHYYKVMYFGFVFAGEFSQDAPSSLDKLTRVCTTSKNERPASGGYIDALVKTTDCDQPVQFSTREPIPKVSPFIHVRLRRVDNRPWVIGYSGGKDSTTALQLVWSALKGLPADKRTKPVYVISSDTLVETPMIVDFLHRTLAQINDAAAAQGLPITSHKVVPTTDDSFWVNLLGRGYPVPSTQFRWCTERLKISPANAFILDRVAEFGEVVVVLGVRSSESSTRAQVMSLHKIGGSHLSRHSTLPKAFVYTPIEPFTVDDVWTYLLQVPSPWGGNNRDLVTLYRNAQAGECPLVVDTTTPSCGNSRFGCWVCTVVNRDASMEAMVENGEEWLEPLLEFRNRLSQLQDSALWPSIRKYKRRDGRIKLKDGAPQPWGPYTFETRKDLLRGLLEVQAKVAADGHAETSLIRKEELEAIRNLWRQEENDWSDSVPQIYREAIGRDADWTRYETPIFRAGEQHALGIICERHGVPLGMVAKLIEVERSLQGMSRRAAIQKRLNSVFEEDWRSADEIFEGQPSQEIE